ncbi:MAG: hypothetical protein ACUVWR_04330 [Anaerolineae bacterium]
MKSTNILIFYPLPFVSQWFQEYFRRIPLYSFLNTDSASYAYNRLLPMAYWHLGVPKAFSLYHPCHSQKEERFIAIDLIATGRRTLLRAYSHNDDALFDWFMNELRRSWPENEFWCADEGAGGPDTEPAPQTAGDRPAKPGPSEAAEEKPNWLPKKRSTLAKWKQAYEHMAAFRTHYYANPDAIDTGDIEPDWDDLRSEVMYVARLRYSAKRLQQIWQAGRKGWLNDLN